MLGRVQRHDRAHLVAQLAAPHACGVDDGIGTNRADHAVHLVLHADGPAALGDDARDLHVLLDADTTRTRTLRQRLRGVDRVGDAVVGQVHATHQVVDPSQRHQFRDAVAVDDVDLQAEHAGHRGAALELLEALRARCHADRTACAEAGGLAGLLLQRGEQVGGVLREPGQVVGGPQLADETGRMPGGAAGELLAFQQHDIGDPAQREVIRDAATDDPTADDDDACVAGQIGHEGLRRQSPARATGVV